MIIEQLINGIGQGLIYALMSIGYALIFGVIGLVTFTHGDIVMLGAFGAFYAFMAFPGNVLAAILSGFIVSFLAGFIVHRICYDRFFSAPRQVSLICTIGMGMFIRNFMQIFAGTETKPIQNLFGSKAITFAGLRINYMTIFILFVVLLMVLALSLFLNHTRLGLSLRSVSQDKKAASLCGIDTRKVTTIGNMLGCGLGGVAGVLYAMNYGSIVPTMGGSIGLKAFCCAVLGGMANIPGAAIGGLLIGIFENLGIAVFSASIRDIVSFVFLIGILLIKPEGLFSRRSK